MASVLLMHVRRQQHRVNTSRRSRTRTPSAYAIWQRSGGYCGQMPAIPTWRPYGLLPRLARLVHQECLTFPRSLLDKPRQAQLPRQLFVLVKLPIAVVRRDSSGSQESISHQPDSNRNAAMAAVPAQSGLKAAWGT